MSEISWEKSEYFWEISESSSHSFVGKRQEELWGGGRNSNVRVKIASLDTDVVRKKENKAVRPFKSGAWLLVALAPGL